MITNETRIKIGNVEIVQCSYGPKNEYVAEPCIEFTTIDGGCYGSKNEESCEIEREQAVEAVRFMIKAFNISPEEVQ